MRKRITKNSIKETFDNLPMGICYFNKNGIPVLCNLQMHRLIFAISGRDLQMLTDLTDALANYKNKDGKLLILPDGRVWQFRESKVSSEEEYIQYVASDITELYRVKKDLEAENEVYGKMLENIKKISDNVVAITREDEILSLKTKIHNKVGICLQSLRRNIVQEKQDITGAVVGEMQTVADMLTREIGNDDELELMDELFAVAKKLGVLIKITGELPTSGEAAVLLAYAMQESLTNTVSHSGGTELYVDISKKESMITAEITDNGKPPKEKITEGGGLSSLRSRIEKAGGIMDIQSLPRFALRITVG